MTAKEYLQQIRKDDIRISQLVKEVDDLRKRTVFIAGIDYSKDRVQASVDGTPGVLKSVETFYDAEIRLNKMIDRFVEEKQRIIEEIQGLDKSEYIEILYKRYFEYDKESEHMSMKSFEQISCEMNLSYMRAAHIHGEALAAFAKKYSGKIKFDKK